MDKQYSILVKRATNLAIIIASLLIIIKAFAWWTTHSITILAAMVDSLVDFLSSLTNILILRFALQPADEEHTFGHGKAESLAALAQSAFITGSAVFLLLQGVQRLFEPQPVEAEEIGIVVSFLSILFTLILLIYQKKIIKITQSPAIQSDSLHYQTDLLMNIAIFISLGLSLYGIVYADALFSIGIAIYILINATKIFYDSMQSLLDKALPQEEIDQIWTIALQHPRIISIHDVRTRKAGAVRFIQLHLEMDDDLPLLIAHEITDSLEQKILSVFPLSEVIIHQEPTSIVQAEKTDASG